jgi:hypothetical protein
VWRAYFAVVLGGIFLSVLTGVFFWVQSDPPTMTLDEDLAHIEHQLKAAADEEAKYTGGLVLTLVQARTEILRLTESMLQAKKLSWLRRVDLTFTVAGQPVQRQPEELAKIEQDLRDSDRRVAEAESKAQEYTGGLLQGLQLANVATEQITRSQLLLAYYSTKYGLIVPPFSKPRAVAAPEPPSKNIVNDKEGL